MKREVGNRYIINSGFEVEVIRKIDNIFCDIMFVSSGFIIYNVRFSSLLSGKIKNRFHPSVYDVGYIGVGKYNSSNKKSYNRWLSMLRRCYSGEFPTYKDITVCDEWHNFQNFAKWFEENWKPWMNSSWELDKDILCKECKTYSPETCCFVPHEINQLYLQNIFNIKMHNNKFIVTISINNTTNYVGTFYNKEEAELALNKEKSIRIKNTLEKYKSKIDIKILTQT